MINTDPERGPGRPPKVVFPIRRTVVIHGHNRELIIQENQTVSCVKCGKPFLINSDTAFIRRNALDDQTCVRCPQCGRVCDASYYLQEPPRPKVRNTERVRVQIPWMKSAW